MRGLVCSLALLLAAGCLNNKPEPTSDLPVGESVRNAGQVALLVSASAPKTKLFGAQFCAGVLAGARVILTAAHCVRGRSARAINVVVGIDNICHTSTKTGERIAVAAIVQPPAAPTADIAALVLSKPATSAPPLPLLRTSPSSPSTPVVPEDLVAVGWGRSSMRGPTPCSRRAVRLSGADESRCAKARKQAPGTFVAPDQICAVPAQGEEANTCGGDSGGPLLTFQNAGQLTLVGLTSWGMGCGSDDVGFYTSVSAHTDWIDSLSVSPAMRDTPRQPVRVPLLRE